LSKLNAYIRLTRLDKPTGIVLLWAPTAWALWIANKGLPEPLLFIYFFLGTVLMRSAGCVINDIADRSIDKHIKRTSLRPLATGEVELFDAILLFVGLIFLALMIVTQLPIMCFYQSLFACFVTILYPFCKRFFDAPQLILGFAFSMGIPMAYSASLVEPDLMMGLLVLLNFLWIIAYDTMYAMVDRDDDLLIGVKSTAVLFASYDRFIISVLQVLFHSIWLFMAVYLHLGFVFYTFWSIALLIIVYQQKLIGQRKREDYFKAFLTNGWYGIIMWLGLGVIL
jgi:4-hydroxybenzoate polyprenyltransferase